MQELLDDIISEDKEFNNTHNRILIGLLFGQLLFAIIALALAFDEVETIVGTGPIGSVIGLIVFGFAYKFDFPNRKKIGLSAPIFSTICFSLVYFLNWSPEEAYTPITTLMSFYMVILLVVVILDFLKSGKRNFEWEEDILDI